MFIAAGAVHVGGGLGPEIFCEGQRAHGEYREVAVHLARLDAEWNGHVRCWICIRGMCHGGCDVVGRCSYNPLGLIPIRIILWIASILQAALDVVIVPANVGAGTIIAMLRAMIKTVCGLIRNIPVDWRKRQFIRLLEGGAGGGFSSSACLGLDQPHEPSKEN